jgi:hypothetical protein
MKNKTCGKILAVAASSAFLSLPAYAQITGNLGTTSVSYGSPRSVQTINTGFGNSTYTGTPNGPDANGSELDAGYGTVSGGNLYLFLAGDFENNGNAVDVFIGGGTGTSGETSWNTTISPLNAMNGSTFSSGFNATLGFNINDFQGTVFTDVAAVQAGTSVGGYIGSVPLTAGIGSGTPSGGSYSFPGFQLALNNSHISTMGSSGAALSGATSGANTTTGLELEIPVADLGTISGNIEVIADINNSSDNFLSNQTLPGLPVGSGNLGGGQLNNTGFFVVPVPEPSSLALFGMSGLGMLMMLRRRK